MNNNVEIHTVTEQDRAFWFSLDKHLSEKEFTKKVRDGQGYVLTVDGSPAGILRYNLFWDNTPFCTLLYIDGHFQRQGYGKALMAVWESDMKSLGYDWLLVSTRSDEAAQHFYRKSGYTDCGTLLALNQPEELFLGKRL